MKKENFSRYFNENIAELIDLHHKGNNRLYVVTLRNDKKYLVKKYSRKHMDDFPRGENEFKSLFLLRQNNFKEIPKPIKFDKDENIGIYSFEYGKIIKAEEIKEENIREAVNFLVKVHSIKGEDKENFTLASSACLCLQDYLDVIDRRLSKMDIEGETEIEKNALDFLNAKVYPKIRQIKEEFLKKVKENNLNLKEILPLSEQVLTPADFGFHNILVQEGKHKFLDFEYFGRDDPARQILDFFHHAKSDNMENNLKQYFIDLYCEKRNVDNKFKQRLRLLSPLIGITWVLIILNVLSKKQLDHLRFAHGNIDNLIKERLKNAEKRLKSIENK